MLIRVLYQDDTYDFIKPFLLKELIGAGRIKKFLRSEGWVTKEQYNTRTNSGRYNGPERRLMD